MDRQYRICLTGVSWMIRAYGVARQRGRLA
jgi:hypothetical protein